MSQNFNMIYFKNEILSDIKKIESTLNTKITQISNLIKSNSEEYNSKFTKYSNIISELIGIVSNRKHDYEKMEELFQMKNSLWLNINENRNKIIIIKKDLEDALFRYDRTILDNLELPGIVGNKCKYKNMRELFEYIYNEIKVEQLFREELNLGNKKYKEKVENLINNLTLRSAEIYEGCSKICVEKIKNFEKVINSRCETTEGMLDNLRVENSKYAIELQEKVDKINIDWNKLQNLKKETYDKINEELKKFNKIVEKNILAYNENKNEFKLIKQKFTQLSEFIRDVRFQKNLVSQRRNSVFTKESNNINFKKKQVLGKDFSDNSFSINNKLNESYDINLRKDKNDNMDSSFISPKKNTHISSLDLMFDKKLISTIKKNEINFEINNQNTNREKSIINFEIEGNKTNIKNLKNMSNKISINKEVELNFLADSLNSDSSSSISDKDEELYQNENKMLFKKFTFRNFNNINNLNNVNDEQKDDKIEEKNLISEEIKSKEKIGKKLKLQSLEFMSIENNKNIEKIGINTERKEKTLDEIKEYSNKYFIRNNKNYRTDYFHIQGKHFINEFDINSDKKNSKGKKLLLTEMTQYRKKTDNSFDNENEKENWKISLKTQKNEENKYYEYPKTSRRNSISKRKLSLNEKDNDYQLYLNSNIKLKEFDNYINKNNENINKIQTKIDFLQNRYLPLLKKIHDLFNQFKHLNNKVTENKINISQLQKKNNNTNNDLNLFLNKTLKARNNKYSLEIKHNKYKILNKEMDNFDTSLKKKQPNDQASIILRKIEPFLIKEFKKKNY